MTGRRDKGMGDARKKTSRRKRRRRQTGASRQ